MMGRCKTCNFWMEGKARGEFGDRCPDGFGGCKCDKNESTIHISSDDWQNYNTDMMVTENDEGWGFWTGADFGCVHHKNR